MSGDEVEDLINDMLQCYTVSATCDMFKQASSTNEVTCEPLLLQLLVAAPIRLLIN